MNPVPQEGDLPLDPTAPGVDELLADARQAEAAARRRRRRWRAEQHADARTIDEVLLGAIGSRVTAHLAGGGAAAGVLEAVGADVAQLDSGESRRWLATAAVVAVEVETPRAGDPAARDGATLADVLEDLAAARTQVVIEVSTGLQFAGTLVRAGGAVELRGAHPGDSVVIRPDAIAAVTAPGL